MRIIDACVRTFKTLQLENKMIQIDTGTYNRYNLVCASSHTCLYACSVERGRQQALHSCNTIFPFPIIFFIMLPLFIIPHHTVSRLTVRKTQTSPLLNKCFFPCRDGKSQPKYHTVKFAPALTKKSNAASI